MTEIDPRRAPKPHPDDDAPGLPSLDGDGDDNGLQHDPDLDVRDDEASALDDRVGGETFGHFETDPDVDASVLDDDDRAAPLEADPSLGHGGENERWTEGSDASEDVPWQEPAAPEATGSAIDRGEEGFDDLGGGVGDALPGLPPARTGDADDEDADELDVSEGASLALEPNEVDTGASLARAEVSTRWHGPAGEAARAVAARDGLVLVAARRLWALGDPPHALKVPAEGEVTALLTTPAGVLFATDAGEVWTYASDGQAVRLARPGTDDASLGGLQLAAIGETVVARTRGGALFRAQGEGWVGPIVAKNVRRIRRGPGADWLALVVGSATAPELLATRDARTFERLRSPGSEIAVDAARSGSVVAVATATGHLHLSHDAGASYALVPSVDDVERVWVMPDGVVLAATFHEATDRGRLIRVRDGVVTVLLDVDAEIATRRLSGPGEHDGDGRIHALDRTPEALWVATGVGVFEIALA